jgi:hypothetical protein
MKMIGIDFESYWATDYTLSKMTTEEYVRDPRFETIMVSIKVDDAKTFWVPKPQVREALMDHKLHEACVYAHHAHFDGLVLDHHYKIRPKLWACTLGYARAIYGANGRLGLAALCEREGIGEKGKEVENAKGLRFADFTPEHLKRYGGYCMNDTDKTYQLVQRYMGQFDRTEIEIHDQIIRMFTEPLFELDVTTLEGYANWLRGEKLALLMQAGLQVDDVMSADRFAQALRDIGIEPPTKISPRTGKVTFAFAKTDPGMQELQDHPDLQVQTLVEARLKNKTTLAERSAERLIGMGKRGRATLYLKYSQAGTHRLAAGDKFNNQAMQRVIMKKDGTLLQGHVRYSFMAPPGMKVIVVDSSTIEARLLDWISGQEDMVEVYRKQDNKTGPDMYCVIAQHIYGRPINKKDDPDERQMGKRTKLGLGFGMGDYKFAISVRREAKGKDGKPLILTPEFAKFVVHDVYRRLHKQVKKFWKRCGNALRAIANGEYGVAVDQYGIVKTCKDGLIMPNGLKIMYPDLKFTPEMEPDPDNPGQLRVRKTQWGEPMGQWSFWNGKLREDIYDAKVAENIIQCLARIIVFNQCLMAVKRCREMGYPMKWKHSVHDEGVFIAPAFFAGVVKEIAEECFRTQLWWCKTLPLNCEGGVHQRYGLAKS